MNHANINGLNNRLYKLKFHISRNTVHIVLTKKGTVIYQTFTSTEGTCSVVFLANFEVFGNMVK